MAYLFGYALLLSIVLGVVSCIKRNEIPNDYSVSESLLQEPLQSPIKDEPFNVSYGGVGYAIEPVFDYVLYGLVVSYRHHDGDSMLHKLWNDHLNMADVCVVWSDNANPSMLRQLNIWNGQFTCNIKTNNPLAWSQFNMDQLSNNHLISENDYIRSQIEELRVGDQIRVKGKLAAYGSLGGGKRGTSTTRTDTGNGACETIYVEDFQILKSMPSIWRSLLLLSYFAIPLCLIGYVMAPHRGR